jgi:hypothetical protein
MPIVRPILRAFPTKNSPTSNGTTTHNDDIADEIAFLVGPNKEGKIKDETLSPIMLTPN